MEEKKLTSIGVLGSNKNSVSYILVKNIFTSLGYEAMLENDLISILMNKGKVIIIFDLTPQVAERVVELKLPVDIIIHTSMKAEDYQNDKVKELIRNAKYFIMNIDEEGSINLLSEDSPGLVISYGLNQKATVTTSSLLLSDNIQFNICIQREILNMEGKVIEPMESPILIELIGVSKVYHVLGVIACLIIYGVELETVKDILLGIKGIYRRLEKIWDNEYIVLDSYCESPLDYSLTLEEIQNLKYNNIYIIKGIDLEDDLNTIRANLETILNWQIPLNIKKLLLYIINNNKGIYNKLHMFLERKGIEYEIYTDLSTCLLNGIKSLEKDDLLLILGGEVLNGARKIFYQLVS